MKHSYIRPLIACAVLSALAGCGAEPPPEKPAIRPVRAAQVPDPSLLTGRSFPGQAKATRELELSFRVTGPLIARPVNIGDVLEKGGTVARIDPTDFEVNLRNVQAQLEQAKAAVARAEADYRRSQNIRREDAGAISEATLDRAREARDSARASVVSLEAAVEDARNQLDYTHLKAPFDGTVVATYVENFEDVRAKQPIVRLLDSSRIEMVVNIPESLISVASEVTDIRVEFDPFPGKPLSAEIKEIGTEASATTRTYPVTLIMDQPEEFKVLPGMAGRATGKPPARMRSAQPEIPLTATFSPSDDPSTYVWVIDPGTKTVSRRAIKPGELTDRGIRVLEGLAAGEWIATAGVHYLKEGQQVRILDEQGSSGA